jgi:hypothetical protein
MAKKKRPKKPSEARCYDVEMIQDFLEHLTWQYRIAHFENRSPGQVHPELLENLKRVVNKRQTVSLKVEHVFFDPERKFQERLNDNAERLHAEIVRCLEALMPIFNQALHCAEKPKVIQQIRLGSPEAIEAHIDYNEKLIRQLKGE